MFFIRQISIRPSRHYEQFVDSFKQADKNSLSGVRMIAGLIFTCAAEGPLMSHEWRQHPTLRKRFHPNAPDDFQVVVHDGGPRLSTNSLELVWVTVTAAQGDVFTGRVLNQPQQLESVSQGSTIMFVAPAGEHLLMVTEKYLAERDKWDIRGCDKCGLNELFDAPSDLMRVIFPGLPAGSSMEMFTSFCGICGGVQIVQNKNGQSIQDQVTPQSKLDKWWQFWR